MNKPHRPENLRPPRGHKDRHEPGHGPGRQEQEYNASRPGTGDSGRTAGEYGYGGYYGQGSSGGHESAPRSPSPDTNPSGRTV